MDSKSPWALGGLTVTELGKRVYKEISNDDVFGRAAQLAYYFLLALFPLLLFLFSVIGVVADDNSELRNRLFDYLGTVLPSREATRLISDNVNQAIETSGGAKIGFGILAALWAASNGMGAITSALNVAYDVEESRSWWRARLTAILLTIVLAVLIITALVGVLYGHDIAEAIASNFGLGSVFEWTWKIVQWPIILLFVLLAFGLIYYFAPNVEEPSWHWVTPGSFVGVGLWLLVSFGFSLYLTYFDSYNATYGSLGAVIVLMLWFYLTGVAILIGGEINSEIENAAAHAGAPDANTKEEHRAQSQAKRDANDESEASDERRATSKPALSRTDATATTASTPRRTITRRNPSSSSHVITRSDGARKTSDKPLTIGKVALVAGSWLFSKVTGKRIGRR